jgi:hypothetical protein
MPAPVVQNNAQFQLQYSKFQLQYLKLHQLKLFIITPVSVQYSKLRQLQEFKSTRSSDSKLRQLQLFIITPVPVI